MNDNSQKSILNNFFETSWSVKQNSTLFLTKEVSKNPRHEQNFTNLLELTPKFKIPPNIQHVPLKIQRSSSVRS